MISNFWKRIENRRSTNRKGRVYGLLLAVPCLVLLAFFASNASGDTYAIKKYAGTEEELRKALETDLSSDPDVEIQLTDNIALTKGAIKINNYTKDLHIYIIGEDENDSNKKYSITCQSGSGSERHFNIQKNSGKVDIKFSDLTFAYTMGGGFDIAHNSGDVSLRGGESTVVSGISSVTYYFPGAGMYINQNTGDFTCDGIEISNITAATVSTVGGSQEGGGMYIYTNYGDVFLDNMVFYRNTVNSRSGAIGCSGVLRSGKYGNLTITNTMFRENRALGGDAAGVSVMQISENLGGSLLIIDNCDFIDNVADATHTIWARSYGDEIDDGIVVEVYNSRFYNNASKSQTLAAGYNLTIMDCEFIGNTSYEWCVVVRNENLDLTIERSIFKDNIMTNGPGKAGAVYHNGQKMLIKDCTITGNNAKGSPSNGGGAGIYFEKGTGIIQDTEISGNVSTASGTNRGGGGIYQYAGTLELIGTGSGKMVVEGNDASTGSGGGIFMRTNAKLILTGDVKINKNNAGNGGGIYASTGCTVTVTDSVELTENTATTDGGAIYLTATAAATLSDTTVISDNRAEKGNGGGIWLGNGNLILSDDTVVTSNKAENGNGGGIYQGNGNIVLEGKSRIGGDTKAEANMAGENGGGIFNACAANNDSYGNINLGKDNVIKGNKASGSGGGVAINRYGAIKGEGEIIYNTAGKHGGGVANIYSSSGVGKTTLESVIISQNNAQENGGGFYTASLSELMADGTVITGNESLNGGGIYTDGAAIMVNNAEITKNTADEHGGGIGAPLADYKDHWEVIEVKDSEFTENTAGGHVRVISTTDQATHDTQISGTSYSDGPDGAGDQMDHAYSDYDIINIPDKFTVIYDLNYNMEGTDPTTVITDSNEYIRGTGVTAVMDEPFREGFKFLGWSKDKEAVTADYQKGEEITSAVHDHIVLYAVWVLDEISFTITKSLFEEDGSTPKEIKEREQFVFRVDYKEDNSAAVSNTLYAVITFEAGDSASKEVIFSNMAPGVYTVTEEDTHWRYTLQSAKSETKLLEEDGEFEFENYWSNNYWVSGKHSVTNDMTDIKKE